MLEPGDLWSKANAHSVAHVGCPPLGQVSVCTLRQCHVCHSIDAVNDQRACALEVLPLLLLRGVVQRAPVASFSNDVQDVWPPLPLPADPSCSIQCSSASPPGQGGLVSC